MGSNCAYLTIINLGSALKEDENYYSRVVWKESKQMEREKKVAMYITEDRKFF